MVINATFRSERKLTDHTDEIALYDRQIRLWGVKAQEKYVVSFNPSIPATHWYINFLFLYRLRSANILLISFKALANEIAKNLVLAGIGSLTIIDHEVVTEADLCAQFFISQEHIGQNVSLN